MSSGKDTTKLRRQLLAWYASNGRAFPWRTQPSDPYVVLCSEVMLQQTQASRIAERLPLFLTEFPTIRHLAQATNGMMIRAWQGLGYNSRALRLRDAASIIVDKHDGAVPPTIEQLRALPGIGAYASAAIACFAYGVRSVVLDVNIRRVYSRWMQRQLLTTDVADDATIGVFAQQVIPQRNADTWHHAVMDLGATICTARKPLCEACPLSSVCPSAHALTLGVRPPKREPQFRGEPVRLWRGRIVTFLQSRDHASHHDIFRGITGNIPADTDIAWITDVIHKLCNDGMVVLDGDCVALPA
jgi:A/G-specific adenine glycosylase